MEYLETAWVNRKRFYSDIDSKLNNLRDMAGTGQEGVRIGMARKMALELRERTREIIQLGEKLKSIIDTLDFQEPEIIDLTQDSDYAPSLEDVSSSSSIISRINPVRRNVSLDSVIVLSETDKEVGAINWENAEKIEEADMDLGTRAEDEILFSPPLKRTWRGGSYTHEGGSPYSQAMTKAWKEQLDREGLRIEELESMNENIANQIFRPITPTTKRIGPSRSSRKSHTPESDHSYSGTSWKRGNSVLKRPIPILPRPVPLIDQTVRGFSGFRRIEKSLANHPRIQIEDPVRRQSIALALQQLGLSDMPTTRQLEEAYIRRVNEVEKIKTTTAQGRKTKALKLAKLWNSRRSIINLNQEMFGGRYRE